jgi:uncharacterized membrane protein YhhN
MKRLVLAHSILNRLFCCILLAIVVTGLSFFFGHVYNNGSVFTILDIIGISVLGLLLIWVLFLFVDSWQIIGINDLLIEVTLFSFRIVSMRWEYVEEISFTTTNRFTSFVQSRLLCFADKGGNKIYVSGKMQDYGLLGEKIKALRPDITIPDA